MISLATSKITSKVKANVNACLNDNRIGQGRFNKEFEQKTAEYLGAKHAIAVNNGSMADIVALGSLKVKYPSKTEVIVPAYTFIAQTNAIFINGLTPVFVDVGDDYQIDVDKIEEKITNKTLCIYAVHLFGKACDIIKIKELSIKHNVAVVEDCCECFGGKVNGIKVGTFGDFGTYSFFPSHTITTGEGGMVVTNDPELADIAKQVANHGRRGDNILDKFHFDVFGFNGKMSNVLASIGCAILPSADKVVNQRRDNVKLYNSILGNTWYAESPHCYPTRYDTEEERNFILERLWEDKIEARKAFSSLPTQEKVYWKYGHRKGDFPMAEKFGETVLFTPVHQDLMVEDIEDICRILKK